MIRIRLERELSGRYVRISVADEQALRGIEERLLRLMARVRYTDAFSYQRFIS
ncbi:MAG: hypothetical protein ACREJX_13025 [Polyangiaceae bacterium]